jgi:outer membrane protein TolC
MARLRFEKGLLASQEAEKAEIDLGNELALLASSQSNLALAKAKLKELLGEENLSSTEWPWKSEFTDFSPKLSVFSEETILRRPDLQMAQSLVEAQKHRESESWRKILGSLDLNFSYGYYHAQSSGLTSERPEWSGSLIFSIPLFDQLSRISDFDIKKHQSLSAEAELERIKRKSRQEWESSKNGFQLALESALQTEKTLLISKKLYADNLARFERGLATVNELNLDMLRLLQSEILAIDGWLHTHNLFVKLCHSGGKQVSECLNDSKH